MKTSKQMQAIDSEIIRRLKGGDKAAFRFVVESCQQMVYSLSVKMLADTEEARDAVQDTFVKVWQNIAGYDERYRLTTWIYTIATRICLDRLKSFSGRMQTTDDAEVFERIADDPDPERRLLASEWVSVIKVMASELSEKQRLVFTLSQLEDLDTAEIMEITGLDADQIKSNLYAAKKNIRERLIKMGYGKDR